LDDADMRRYLRRRYLRMLGQIVTRYRWRCLAYCLMPNHVHLLLETPEPNLPQGMQALHGDYAVSFNRRNAESGHVFQGRYGATLVTTDEQLRLLVRYVARNPVEAGLAAMPHDWRWSSDHALRTAPPAWLDVARTLSYLDVLGGDPHATYEALVG
jgi:REP element-mobilizing transposase RayT